MPATSIFCLYWVSDFYQLLRWVAAPVSIWLFIGVGVKS